MKKTPPKTFGRRDAKAAHEVPRAEPRRPPPAANDDRRSKPRPSIVRQDLAPSLVDALRSLIRRR